MKTFLKIAGKTLLWTVGIILSLLIVMEIVLSGRILTGIVSKVASEYVDGDIHFGKVSASMFRRFPAVTLSLEDFHITYPSDRFDESEKLGVQGHLMYKGCSDQADTLASFRKFAVGVSIPELLGGRIGVPYLRLDHPRIFAHSYADGKANWDMFITSDEEEEADTSSTDSELPKITIGKVMMTGKPHIVYTDSRDTIFAMINLQQVMLSGKIKADNLGKTRVGLTLDSMFVAGRVGRDTLAAGLDRLYIHEEDRNVNIEAAAKAFLATSSFGRLMVPMSIDGTIQFPEKGFKDIRTDNLRIEVLNVPVNIGADVHLGEAISFTANASVPYTVITHPKFPEQELRLQLDVLAETDNNGRINVSLDRLKTGIKGFSLNANGKVNDALGNDPLINLDGAMRADIDSLARFIPDSLGINASGQLQAKIKGGAKLSQLDIYNFSQSTMTGELLGDSIVVSMPNDTIDATIKGLRITLGPEEKTSRRDAGKSFKLMGISGEIANADISYKESIQLHASDFKVSAKNIIDNTAPADTSKKIYPFGGRVSAGKLYFKDSEGTSIRLDESNNSFNVFPKKGQPKVPVLTFSSNNKRLFLKSDVNRAMISDANIKASAAMNTVEKRKKIKAMRDSLARVYPDIPRDSLFKHVMAKRGPQQAMPEWLKEEDFRKQDIDISLDKSMAKYFNDWDLKGSFSIDKGMVMTPYFPLRNHLDGFNLDFTNDKIAINQFKIRSGESDISATGELTGLKRALLGRKGMLNLDAEIRSEKVNADQLMAAYTSGSNFNPESMEGHEDISDDDYMEHIVLDTTAVASGEGLLVVPGNLNANICLHAGNINYSELLIDTLTAHLTMKERCIQITETQAVSNMGGISFEGFYATRTKQDIKTGFDINFSNITAEKVIDLMPSIDTLMPLLKSFGGLLNCEVAATAQLDTNMNILMPSINGIMRISGDDLTIKNSDMFQKMAKMLMFKNKKEGHIDKMTVEGVIQDSKVEIFPFILEMDRYMLGLSGVQNMDMSYKYHASLIKSPFLIKLGMDVYGNDFDNMKFKIGKAKYKSRNVPVFSTVIDDTKINLVESIRNIFDKGVDAVINDSRRMKAIEDHKKSIGYVQAVDQKMEELSESEQKQLEAEAQKDEDGETNTENGAPEAGKPEGNTTTEQQ